MLTKLTRSLAFSALLFLSLFKDLFGSLVGSVFHSPLATPSIFFATLANILIASVLCYALLTWLSESGRWSRGRVAILILAPIILVAFNRLLTNEVWIRLVRLVHAIYYKQPLVPPLAEPVSYPVLIAGSLAWAALLLLIWKFAPRLFQALLALARIAALSAGLFAVFLLANLLLAGIRRAGNDRTAPIFATSAGATPPTRVVWIVLDELSYKQAFERRVPDLALPNLDHLRAESTMYTNARPVALNTDNALPGMLLGTPIDATHYRLPDRLSYFHDADQQWHAWDPQQTVLADAERAHRNVALIGWWNPYCTMLSGMLQQCAWSASSPYNPMRMWYGVGKNMAVAWTAPFRNLPAPPLLIARDEENLYLLQRGLQALADDRFDFVMVHLGMPHYPYLFDRHTGKPVIEPGHSYQDGLAMADAALGQLLHVIEANPRWRNTVVIVNGDHSWRPSIWTQEPGWTEEDERTSDARKMDDRPALLIHAAGQTAPLTVSQPTSLMQVHDTMEAAIHAAEPKP